MSGYPIIAAPSAARETVLANLDDTTGLFRDEMFPVLWDVAEEYGIDPVGMVAQSFKETGGGTYSGRVKPFFYNAAGIKVRHVDDVLAILDSDDGDHPLVHQQFPNWPVGAHAHAQRLLDYCLIPIGGLIVDPRHGFGNRGISTWAELGGRWATSPTYGTEVEAIMVRLRTAGTV